LESLRRGLAKAIERIKRAPVIDAKTLREVEREIQRALLQADVSAELVLKVTRGLEERVKKSSLPPGFSKRELLLKAVYEELVELLGGEVANIPQLKRGRTNVFLLVGVEGSGKTTTAAKLAYYYKKRGCRVGLVCADNYRPGALDQLRQLGEKIGVEVYGREGVGSAVDLALEGVDYFRGRGCDLVIVDTAGRHKDERSLMEEVRELYEALRPDQVVLVLDATMGRQAERQALAFKEMADVGTIVVAKLDGAARGGGALAAVVRTGARISFIGTGEGVEELEVFDPPSFVSRLLGMGDLKALVEKFRSYEELSRKRVEAIARGDFTLQDLLDQLLAIRKMGPLRKLLELIPGGTALPVEVGEVGEENIKKWIAIMQSMTREELLNPDIIDRDRVVRIARGSGTTIRDVKNLLKSYKMARKYLRKMARRRVPRGFPGISP